MRKARRSGQKIKIKIKQNKKNGSSEATGRMHKVGVLIVIKQGFFGRL